MKDEMAQASLVLQDERALIRVPMRFKRRGGRKQIILPQNNTLNGQGADTNAPVALAVARAHRWLKLLEGGLFRRVSGLAMRLKIDEAYVRRQLRLTLLAPDIVEAIFEGREPSGLSIDDLMKAPVLWEEQRRRLGFDSKAWGVGGEFQSLPENQRFGRVAPSACALSKPSRPPERSFRYD